MTSYQTGQAKLIRVRVPFRKSQLAWEYEGRRFIIGGSGPLPVGAIKIEEGVFLNIESGQVYTRFPGQGIWEHLKPGIIL